MGINGSLKPLRMESGLSQRELSEKLKVDRATIIRWESGESYPKKKMVDRILKLLPTMDVSERCKQNIKDSLADGRRQGTSASEYGIDDIDLELICDIVDDSANAVYAIEVDTYKVLYINKRTQEWMNVEDKNRKFTKCYEYLAGSNVPCPDCPLNDISDYEFSEHTILKKGNYYKVRGRKKKWNGKDIYITYVSNVTDLVREQEARRKFIELMPTGVGVYRFYLDGRLELVYLNDGFYRMFGIKREDSKIQPGFTKLGLIHSDDIQDLRKVIKVVMQNPDDIFTARYRADIGNGEYREVILRGLVVGKTEEYYTFNCSFITTKLT